MDFFNKIFWIDLDIEEELKGYYLLGNTLSAISRLSKECTIEPGSQQNKSIIGIDLLKLSLSLGQSLGDLSYVVNKFPIFGFNYRGSITKSDNITQIINTLNKHHQIIPIINGLSIYDSLHHNITGDKLIEELLIGQTQMAPICNHKIIDNICNSNPLYAEILQISGLNLFDKTNIHWLGVRDQKIIEMLNILFNMKNPVLNFSEFSAEHRLNTEERTLFESYIKNSNLFFYDKSNDQFLFKFIRNNILPNVRGKIIKEFEEELGKANLTEIQRDIDDNKIFYWYYNFGKLFKESSHRYIDKLGIIINEIVNKFKYDRIVLEFKYNSNYFSEFVENIFNGTDILKVIKGINTRLFPYHTVKDNEQLFIITDIINTGNTIHKTIDLISNKGANVSGIFSFVINSELDIKNGIYQHDDNKIPIFYFVKKKLKKAYKQSSHKEVHQLSKENELRNIIEYSFFWELVQGEGRITHKHYITSLKDYPFEHVTHWDTLLELDELEKSYKESELIIDFINKFQIKFYGKKFGLILSNTSRYAGIISKVIKNNIDYDVDIISGDFSNVPLDINLQQNGDILLVDDGTNSYGSLVTVTKWLLTNGFQNRINICVLLSRKCVGEDHLINSNMQEVICGCNLFVYYKSAIPFYVLTHNRDNMFCPNCYFEEYYKRLMPLLFSFPSLADINKKELSRLPPKKEAPIKIQIK